MHSVVIAAARTVRTMPVQEQPTSASASISCTVAVREHSAKGLLALPPKVGCDDGSRNKRDLHLLEDMAHIASQGLPQGAATADRADAPCAWDLRSLAASQNG